MKVGIGFARGLGLGRGELKLTFAASAFGPRAGRLHARARQDSESTPRPFREMMGPMDYVIRPLAPGDEAILWEMLYVALQAPGGEPPPREIVKRPEYARFVETWGREGDRGFVAHDSRDQRLLGAVWMRKPKKNATPELAVAVVPGERKRGIGAALLTQWVRANPEQNEVLLHVGPKSPAVRLYERFGFRVADKKEHAVTMRRDG